MTSVASPTPLGAAKRMPLRMTRPIEGVNGANVTYTNGASSLKRASPFAKTSHADPPATTNLGVPGSDEDSSDDEVVAAPVLSAAAEEILGGRSGGNSKPSSGTRATHVRNYAEYAGGSPIAMAARERERDENVPRQRSRSTEVANAVAAVERSPRVVRVSTSPGSAMMKRTKDMHVAGNAVGSPAEKDIRRDYKTPAPRPKSYMGSGGREDQSPSGGSRQHASGEHRSDYYSSGKSGNPSSGGADDRNGPHTQREHGIHSSIRVKRIGQTGTFLRGPARRGIIRRQSEEDQSPLQRNSIADDEPLGSAERGNRIPESPVAEHLPSKVRFAGPEDRPTTREGPPAPLGTDKRTPHERDPLPSRRSSSAHRRPNSVAQQRPESKPKPHTDKENEPPSMLESIKPSPLEVFADMPEKPALASTRQPEAAEVRPPLTSKTTNTPLRPAPPPPPKMNVVDAATAAAGAMASKSRKKQAPASMQVNGRRFTRLDCIGRGGSGKVFRVMAENYKQYALKRVSLEGMDEAAIRGFKGEINLLQRLKDVDRVVRLIDYEVNDERQTLTVLMEMGELDLKKVLDPRLDEQTGKFDVTFTRYIWREMLECVKSVHEYDVVHSDLKPANFVMVSSRLKLIDFGIANAIADDTVNVHREQQIGTPNYMAPEALVDTNAHDRGMLGVGKLMKLGKPSDVWSLGCMLYQIVYGKPPFGHITQTHNKVLAIVSDKHPISFPEKGLGDVPVPIGLLRTLKACLQRNKDLRPTIDQLLSDRDPFLHPDADGLIPLSEDLLGMIQRKLCSVIKQRGGVPDDGELALWQANMFENVRIAIRDGKVTP